MSREEQLELAVKNLLAIIDSPEMDGAVMVAWGHGYRVDPAVSSRNGTWIDAAYALLGQPRPKK